MFSNHRFISACFGATALAMPLLGIAEECHIVSGPVASLVACIMSIILAMIVRSFVNAHRQDPALVSG